VFGEEATFGESQRKQRVLVYRGFSYIRNGEFLGSVNWRCSSYRTKKCKAKAVTKKINGLEYVKPTYEEHNHELPKKAVAKRKEQVDAEPVFTIGYVQIEDDEGKK
jgi:hypothetical protein